MKSLRVYFVMALVWLLAGLSLVACSKKDKNGGGVPCPVGMIQQNGYCTYDPNNPGNGYPNGSAGSGIYYGRNGHIDDNSHFRDLQVQLEGTRYYCYGGGYINGIYYDCQHTYVALIKYGNATYVQIATPSLYNKNAFLYASKWSGSTASQTIYEIKHQPAYSPSYQIAELVIYGNPDTDSSVSYVINYLRNTGERRQIVSGTMRKNYDY